MGAVAGTNSAGNVFLNLAFEFLLKYSFILTSSIGLKQATAQGTRPKSKKADVTELIDRVILMLSVRCLYLVFMLSLSLLYCTNIEPFVCFSLFI